MSHLYFLEDQPELIPYKHHIIKKLGFLCCRKLISSKKFQGPFKVKINADFKKNGNLIWENLLKRKNRK